MDEGGSGARQVPARRRWWLAGAAAAAVALVCAVVLLSGRDDGAQDAGVAAGATAGATPSGEVAGATAAATDAPADAGEAEPGASADEPAEPAPAESGDVATVTVPIDAVAQLADAVTARVSDVDAVQGEAVQPGEVAGPALRVTVELTNDSAGPLDLRAAVVNLYHGVEQVPAISLSQPGGSPLPQSADPGQTVSGAFVFRVPEAARDDVRVELDVRPVGPVVLFSGPVQG